MKETIYKKMYYCRQFELWIAELIKHKLIKLPTYLSIGEEATPAVFTTMFPDVVIFPQHRCHSWFLCAGGNPLTLLAQLLGKPYYDLQSNGMQGSASLSIPNKLFGHSGLLGDQVPVAVGYADSKRQDTICVLGDGACEEDYVLASLGYAATKNVPITFVVEDNNLSILTTKAVRRSWSIVTVAAAFGVNAYECHDDVAALVNEIESMYHQEYTKPPKLINVNVERHYWHAGAGQDNPPKTDRLLDLEKTIDTSIIEQAKLEWQLSLKQLEKLLERTL
jgi:TPP-dependent pyruvate/acetoin dehydrogenase alpha subunit